MKQHLKLLIQLHLNLTTTTKLMYDYLQPPRLQPGKDDLYDALFTAPVGIAAHPPDGVAAPPPLLYWCHSECGWDLPLKSSPI